MARKPNNSEQEIIEAGINIEKRGAFANEYAIRNELNGGRTSRIKKMWEAHKEGRDNNHEATTVQGKLPADLQVNLEKLNAENSKTLYEIATKVWCHARDIAEARLAKSLHEHNEGLERLKHIEIEANRAIEFTDTKVENLETDLEEERLKTQEQRTMNAKLQGQLTLLNDAFAKLEKVEILNKELMVENAQMKIEIKHMRETSIFYPGRSIT